jgi:hypothetical protein
MNTWKRFAFACVSFVLLGLAPQGAALAQVKVAAATPSSAFQGTTALEVVVTGSGFDPTARVQYFVSGTTNPGGITVRNVTYRKSTELVTTIDIADGASLESFDIQVTLDSGRKGKGTTLFSVKQKPNDPLPLPTYPAARAWHAFTSNGGSTVSTSRLYMYGGAGSDWQPVPADLWYYGAHADTWTLVTPATTTRPGRMQWNGLSCGPAACVVAGGSNIGLLGDTWVYSEVSNAWTLVTCSRRAPCPAPRQMVTMAFDSSHGYHVLFGGRGSSNGLNDTHTFDAATLKWTARSPAYKPAERNRAAVAHVPGVGVVMHGGQDYYGRAALCDVFAWDGSNWIRVEYDVLQPHPCLHSHSMAWDGQGLLVSGGYVDTSDTASLTHWRFAFAANGRSGTWSKVSAGTCHPVLGTDIELHPGGRMAYDLPTSTRVYFGGEANAEAGVVRFDNTVECY